MDLLLVKPRAYRHFLFNTHFLLSRMTTSDASEEEVSLQQGHWKRIVKRFLALSLVDAYLRWFYLCAYQQSPLQHSSSTTLPASTDGYALPDLVTTASKHLSWGPGRTSATSLMSSLKVELSILSSQQSHQDITQRMIRSFALVWLGTVIETFALYATVTIISASFVALVRRKRTNLDHAIAFTDELQEETADRDDSEDERAALEDASAYLIWPAATLTSPAAATVEDSSDEEDEDDDGAPLDSSPPQGIDLLDLYRPHLVPTALLLSSLSTLLLLSIVLLWEAKLPRHPSNAREEAVVHSNVSASAISARLLLSNVFASPDSPSSSIHQLINNVPPFSIDLLVRTILGGLSAIVALSVLHPGGRGHSGGITTSALILTIGWCVSMLVRREFTQLPFVAAHAAEGSHSETAEMRRMYCGW